jgi:hypothetical protein
MLGAVMACTDLVLADYAEKRNGLALLQVDSEGKRKRAKMLVVWY